MIKKQVKFPEIIEKTESEIEHIISVINNSSLPKDIKSFVIKCIEMAMWLPNFVLNTKISMRRFTTMIFGKGYGGNQHSSSQQNSTNKSNNHNKQNQDPGVNRHPAKTNGSASEPLFGSSSEPLLTDDTKQLEKTSPEIKPGHGKMPHDVYSKSIKIKLELKQKVGDLCTHLCGGKLNQYKPGNIIRITGNPIATVYHYVVDKRRCNKCQAIITANIPPELIKQDKYDAYFKAQLVLLKYYVGVPFYRQENFQRLLNFPLSDATQWDLCEQVSGSCIPVFNVLKTLAANGELIHNDDTWLKILSVIKKIKDGSAGKRSGMYTTSILSYYKDYKIALFLNGRNHSGENMADILKLRSPAIEPVIQMCDALSANIPSGIQTILCNCLPHGVRKFKELVDFFPEECIKILKMLGHVFENDALTKKMTKQKRLEYHQEHSKPVMAELHAYMADLLDAHHVEPNGQLGKALKYMLKHWPKLTRFLTVAGAPISNNIVERALKIAILNRKAAMFYRTEYSAYIGGVLTSLIYTCHLNQINPQDYLTDLQMYNSQAAINPELFLPWNYQNTIKQLLDAANVVEPQHQRDGPAAA